MTANESVDITSRAFALRLGNLLVATRTHDGRGVGAVARASHGSFSKADLKAYEHAERTIDETSLDELAQLYRCDLGEILPLRLPVVVDAHRISAGGVHQNLDSTGSDAVLAAYLTLVRTLRHQKKSPVVDLRRDDIEVLAGFLAQPGQTVVERLAVLMNATQTKRTAMIGVFATGAVVIGLVGTAMAVSGTALAPADSRPNNIVAVTTTTGAPSVTTNSAAPSTTETTSSTSGVAPTTAVGVASTVGNTTLPATPTTVQSTTKPTQPPLIESTVTPTTVAVVVGPPPVPTAAP
jgi:hypothetical protein